MKGTKSQANKSGWAGWGLGWAGLGWAGISCLGAWVQLAESGRRTAALQHCRPLCRLRPAHLSPAQPAACSTAAPWPDSSNEGALGGLMTAVDSDKCVQTGPWPAGDLQWTPSNHKPITTADQKIRSPCCCSTDEASVLCAITTD